MLGSYTSIMTDENVCSNISLDTQNHTSSNQGMFLFHWYFRYISLELLTLITNTWFLTIYLHVGYTVLRNRMTSSMTPIAPKSSKLL